MRAQKQQQLQDYKIKQPYKEFKNDQLDKLFWL